MSRRDNTAIVVSFMAGAATAASLIVWFLGKRDSSGAIDKQQKQKQPTEQQQNWMEPLLSMNVGELKNSRIGELPDISRSNMRWPWEKMRQPVKEPKQTSSETDHENPMFKSPVKPQEKTGLCIGSIFGLDVGGTLAKLVYFEERQLEGLVHNDTSEHDPIPTVRRRTSTDDIWDIRKSEPPRDTEVLMHDYKRHQSMPPILVGGGESNQTMFELSKSHAEALGQFYHFARTFDSSQSGLKDSHLSFYSRELGGDFHFIRFETQDMVTAMDLIRNHNLHLNIREMGATGGGAHKFANVWERVLGIEMMKQEELDSLVAGMQFVLSTVVGECYTFRPRIRDCAMPPSNAQPSDHASDGTNQQKAEENSDHDAEVKDEYQGDDWWWSRKVQRDVVSVSETYPYLLVNIGTGVSILRVDGPREHERISGSTIGGGTYWGLIRLLTDIDDFEAVMKLAERGDPSKVDMMVGDIYGKNSDALEKIGLPSNLVASSFGKLVAKRDPAVGLKQEDLARALLLMVTNNIGQVAYLNAKLHKTPRIYFIGNFLRGNKLSQRRLSYAINYWSKGEMEALFLEHEGYFGALGAFLLSQGISHSENGFFQWDKCQQAPRDSSPTTTPDEAAIRKHRRSKTTG